MSTSIRHVVFDIGQVLVYYDPVAPFVDIIPEENRRKFFFDNVCTSEWNVEQDRGREWAEAEALAIGQHPEFESEIRAFRENWTKMVPHSIQGSVDILTALEEQGHDVTFLTNFAADTFLEAQEMYPFLKSGRGVTVSGRVKRIKPDPEIYRLHTERFELDPAATLFIDDSPKNVAGAQEFGWNAVQFTNAEALQSDLERFGFSLE